MKRIIFIMVAMMLSMAASAQTTNKTLYIVDGKVVSEEQANTIKNEDVVNMNVIEGIESAVIINTTKSANDVVVIRGEKDSDADVSTKRDSFMTLTDGKKTTKIENPLMLLTDGEKTMKIESIANSNITPDDILHMTVIDFQSLDSAAAEQYKKYGDPSNGVIIIQVKDIEKYKKEK